ncbi:MAG: putative bifunctional diguanylate cyclase/phosphodiesterase [Myxococcota bacterium]
MSRPRVSVAVRLMALMVALAGGSIGVTLALQDRALWQDLEGAAVARLDGAASGSLRLLADHLREQAVHYAAVARTPEFRANLETGQAATLRYCAGALLRREGAAAVVFVRRNGSRVAGAGEPAVAAAARRAFASAGSAAGERLPCVRAGAAAGDLFSECSTQGNAPEATLVPAGGAVYAVIRVPLATRGRALGSLIAAVEFDPETLASWSRLTGCKLSFTAPTGGGSAPLDRSVIRFGEVELRAGSSLERERAMLDRARRNLVGVGSAALLLAAISSAVLAQGFVRPIREIRRATELVGEGQLSARLDIQRNDEIGDVAVAFNETLRRLHESRERVRVAQRLARFGDWSLDPDTHTLEGSPEFWRIVGVEPSTPQLSALLAQIHSDDREALDFALRRCAESGHSFRLEVYTKESSSRALQIQAQRESEGQGARVEASVQDVTEQRAVERQIRYLAYHDSLTGLGNRRFFEERAAVALTEARRQQQPMAVLFLDLDRFKSINDSLGHSAGDAILQETASRLLAEIQAPHDWGRSEPAVARLGGDEFMILLPAPADAVAAASVGHAILRRVSAPIRFGAQLLTVTGSIGIAIWPDDGADVEGLLRGSDTAMYFAKSRGPAQLQLCTEGLTLGARRRLELETRLREAVERDDLALHFQPRVDARTSRIVGFEALLRWRDPDLGVVSPADFIPIAEDAGLISSLGRWVLQRAASQAKAWRDEGLGNVLVSVNLSALQLQADFLHTFDEIVDATGVDPRQIELEVTESAVAQHIAQAVETFEALRRRGARIALDDFGTGYSSFSTLRELPVDTFKIDRSFVKPMAHDDDAAALVAGMISMARVLRLRVVAEGVEEEEQQELLQEMGCDELQGFLFSDAVTAPEAGRLLTRRGRAKMKRRRRP